MSTEPHSPWWNKLAIGCSLLVFVLLTSWFTQHSPVWHEEVSVYPNRGNRVLFSDFGKENSTKLTSYIAPWCGQSNPPRTVFKQTRPKFGLCVAGYNLPVMITSYFSGIFYWPFALLSFAHHGNAFRLRLFGMIWGLLNLWVTYRLVRKISGESAARLTLMVSCLLSPFVLGHTLLVHYESLPWLFVSLGLLQLSEVRGLFPNELDNREHSPLTEGNSAWRWWLAFLCFGFALLANIKALFFLVTLSIFIHLAGYRWQQQSWKRRGLALLGISLPLVPLVVASLLDPKHGFSQQVGMRIGIFLRHLNPIRFVIESANVLVYWSDVGVYGDYVATNQVRLAYVTLLIPLAAMIYATRELVQFLRKRPANHPAALCASWILTWLTVSVLLYDQLPSANYAPLHSVFGITIGLMLAKSSLWLSEFVKRKYQRPLPLVPLQTGMAVVCMLLLGWNLVKRGDPDAVPFSINAYAEKQVSSYLISHPDAHGETVTATYNYAGVFESLGNGKIIPLQIHQYLHDCLQNQDKSKDLPCLEQHFQHLLRQSSYLPLRVIVPSKSTIIDEKYVNQLVPALQAAAARENKRFSHERSFATSQGMSVIELYRIE
jgi:lipid-A-disaccharide synthase-like uncharacterized protein